MSPNPTTTTPKPPLDVLILGTGFAGTYLLHRLLNLNYNVLAIDASSQLGGVWNHNTYPGSRVDIEVPYYQLSLPELFSTPKDEKAPSDDGFGGFRWKERFPGREELQAYFRFVEQRLGKKGEGEGRGLSKYCVFQTWVESAVWEEREKVWVVRARDGREWRARWFLPCVGYASKPYVPDFPGLESFEGSKTHTANWSQVGGALEVEGKRVGVVGTGASGVQVIQTIAPIVGSLTVFQQTPALVIPMRQKPFDTSFQKKSPEERNTFFNDRLSRWDGASGTLIMRTAKSDTPEQREAEFSRLWEQGGFSFWTSNYMDAWGDVESNDLIYGYWARQIRKRINDPEKRDLLAPLKAPYAFGTKRVPLEQTYYESYNLPHVDLVNLREDPIAEVIPEGLKLKSGATYDLDVLILATGFDFSVGSMTQLDIRGTNGLPLSEKWSNGTKTQIGMAVEGFPNMLFPYGPQSPSNTCCGPVCAEVQGEWIVKLLESVREKGQKRVEAEKAAEEEWSAHATRLLKGTLFEGTKSYYFADNVPGRKREPLFYFGGLPGYKGKLEEVQGSGYGGFNFQ
ncbi:MAG: hypothetical protein M1820_000097 [Bogoriella megaspora]|nr:MAG: hypothetical protein M1820_000097 [Bogoriella megaspora]